MFDFAIIGSGVSGGRIADSLTAGGAECVLLEAGREFDRHSFPPDEMGASTEMFWGGGVEISKDGRFGFLRGKCLGGTSVVNQADLDRFDDMAWDAWRDQSGIDFFRAEQIDPVYDRLDATVAMGQIPREHWNQNAHKFIKAFDTLGHSWRPITRSQTDCAHEHGSDCIVCLGGCPRDAKQSTLITSIRNARQAGLTVETGFEVDRIDDRPDQVVITGSQHGESRQVTARRAVLAAGAIGNTALLWRSIEKTKRSPALGTAFCCHPQYMLFGVFDQPINAHLGALQSVQAHDDAMRRAGMKFENVFAGPIAISMLMPAMGRRHHALMRKYRHIACIEVAVMDDPTGRISLNRKGKVVLEKPLTAEDQSKIDRGLEIVRELLGAAGAKEIIECEQGFGLHLMGGCPMGVDPASSIIGPDFRLHGSRNLFAADSSVFPRAPGINPSYTIMALGELASNEMLAR